MLRGAKQLGTLSQSARPFFLTSSRCGTADGSSPSPCEDDNYVSKRLQKKNEIPKRNIPSAIRGLKPSVAVGCVITRDSKEAINSLKPETVGGHPVSVPQVIPAPTEAVVVAASVNSGSVDNNAIIMHTARPIEKIVHAGVAAVAIFSDFVGGNIMIDGSSSVCKPKNVVRAHPKNNVTTDVNGFVSTPTNVVCVQPKTAPEGRTVTVRAEKIQGKSYIESAEGSSARNNSPASKVNTNVVITSVNSTPNLPYNGSGNSFVSSSHSSYPTDQKRPMPEKSRNDTNGFTTSNERKHSVKNVKNTAGGFTRPIRETRLSNGVSPATRQFPGCGHIVDRVTHILQQLKWGPATEDALRKLNCCLDAYQANQVLKKLQDYPVALGFFYWLKRQPGFKHDGHTYTTMVGILGRARQFGTINKLLDQMSIEGCPPNVVTFNRIIHSYGRANYLNEALRVFNQMQKFGCEPDRVSYCTLIDLHAKAGYLEVAMDMYSRMQEVGLTPDTFTYSVIINCLGKAGHLTDAHKIFCEMVNQGCTPNLVTYNIMIDSHAKARNYQSALQLYRDMQNAGFEPDKVTYSIIMEVLGHCGYLEEVEALFVEMKRKNWVPDEPVYGLLVDLYGKSGNVQKAWWWYQSMLNAGLCPNVPTCNSLLSAFLRVHRLQDAYNLLQRMLNLGLHPSLQTYTLLLSCCTEAKTSYDMGFCCELMATTGHPAHTFLLSMPSPGPDGQNVRDHVSNFLDYMHSENRESKRGLVDAVVDFFHKTGLKEEAGSIWEVAVQKNVYPDAVREKSSCYWLINLHVMSDGTAVTALSRSLAWFRRQMLVSGVCPNRIDIVTGWGRRSRVTGSSLVRHAVYELLNVFSFPFVTENGNSGCFVGCGEQLNRWLLHPYVERMHLL